MLISGAKLSKASPTNRNKRNFPMSTKNKHMGLSPTNKFGSAGTCVVTGSE